AVFETETPTGFAGGTVVTFALHFKNNDKHAIGRLRLSLTAAKPPVALQGPGMPERIPALLAIPQPERTGEQQAELLKWYSTIDPECRKLDQAVQEHLLKAPKPLLAKALISSEGLTPVRLHSQGEDFLPETHFLRRGDSDQKDG